MVELTLVRAPDAAPTGKTSERVKERLWFYSFYFFRQSFSAPFNLFRFNRVQPVHKPVKRDWCRLHDAMKDSPMVMGEFRHCGADDELLAVRELRLYVVQIIVSPA
jgi:hypothetical protein